MIVAMENLFGTPGLSAGYATSRPRVHPLVIDLLSRRLRRSTPFDRALDVGCGAGLSTAPLNKVARRSVGIEPAESMLQWAFLTAPNASFVAGRAEELPFQDGTMDLITAAGSLNYVNLVAFFAEARRVLAPDGDLVVYDFSPGRCFRTSNDLDPWFVAFLERYPPARDSARSLDPGSLCEFASGFSLSWSESFEIALPLNSASYEDYMMTETNVAFATHRGTPEPEIRNWLHHTLRPIFADVDKEVLFTGYIACFVSPSGA